MPSSTPAPNPNVPPTPQPTANLQALATVVNYLKQGVDSLGGNRGNPLDRAVTFRDLINYGLLSSPTLDAAPIMLAGVKGATFDGSLNAGSTTVTLNTAFVSQTPGIVLVVPMANDDSGSLPNVTWSPSIKVDGNAVASDGPLSVTNWSLPCVAKVGAGNHSVSFTISASGGAISANLYMRAAYIFIPTPT